MATMKARIFPKLGARIHQSHMDQPGCAQPGDSVEFSYDWTTGKLTITATAPGLAPVVRIVDPPDSYRGTARIKLLPDL